MQGVHQDGWVDIPLGGFGYLQVFGNVDQLWSLQLCYHTTVVVY